MAESRGDAQTFVPDSETRCRTRLTSFSHSHTWTIENYRFYEEEKILSSSTFSSSGYDDIKWYIELFPQGETEESKDYISIFLNLDTSPLESLRVEFELTLFYAKQQVITHGRLFRIMKPGGNWGFRKFVERDRVMNRSQQLCNDELSLRCDMMVAMQTVNIPIEVPPIPNKTSKRCAADILEEFLQNRSSKDAASTLPTEGSCVRKELLKTFPPIWKAIFERDFATTGSSRKEISEMDENTFMEFVRFIYVDGAEAPDSLTKYLLAAIDKYAPETLSSTAAPSDALKISPTKPVDEDISSLVAEAKRLQVCGAAANESQFVQQEKDHNGEESGNDSQTSDFSVLEDC